jgi:hypothetical protein
MRGGRRVRECPRRAQRAAETGIEVEGRQLLPREPPESPRLRGEAAEARIGRRDDQVAQIQMPVRRLVAAGRDRVHVDVERPRRIRVQRQPLDACLLSGLPQGNRLAVPLIHLRMTARLEPPAELPVVEQEHPVARRRDDDRAAREMPLDDPAVERVSMTVDEREDLGQVRRFLGIRRHVPPEVVSELQVAGEVGHVLGHGGNRRRFIYTHDIRTPSSATHDLQHGRATTPAVSTEPDRLRVWHTRAVGLGRTTRFAPLPEGARRVSVMRAGTAGIKALAPSPELLADFQVKKQALMRVGKTADQAHVEAHSLLGYRERYLAEIKARPEAMAALRALIAESRDRDVYLMCMCRYNTPGRACHTYALLDLARVLDPVVRELPEPVPTRHATAGQAPAASRGPRTP